MQSGLIAEFADREQLLVAISRLRSLGYADLDAFTPYPVHGLEERLGLGRSPINWLVFPLGMAGALGAFFLQWYCNAWSYPLNVGGRPPFAVPAFIPITFEMGVLASGVSAFLLLFVLIGLPRLHHPLHAVPGFERASLDRFWLAVGAGDAAFERERTTRHLLEQSPLRVVAFGSGAP